MMSLTPKRMSNAWKQLERDVANDFGGKRTGARGLPVPDVENQVGDIAIECKYMNKISLRQAHLEQAERNARGRPWLLVLRKHRSRKKLAVVDYDYFRMLYLHYHEGK